MPSGAARGADTVGSWGAPSPHMEGHAQGTEGQACELCWLSGRPTRPRGAGRVAAPWRWSLRRARHVLPKEVAPNQGQALLGGREVSQAPPPVSLPGHHYRCADFGRRSGGAGASGAPAFRLPIPDCGSVAQVTVLGGGPSPGGSVLGMGPASLCLCTPHPAPHLLSKQNIKIQRRKLKCRNLGRIWAPVSLRVGDGDGAREAVRA